jgi:hypothetical protein
MMMMMRVPQAVNYVTLITSCEVQKHAAQQLLRNQPGCSMLAANDCNRSVLQLPALPGGIFSNHASNRLRGGVPHSKWSAAQATAISDAESANKCQR